MCNRVWYPIFPIIDRKPNVCLLWERNTHASTWGVLCQTLFYNLGSLSPHSCPYMGYPRVLDAFPQLTVRSKWKFLKHRGTLILWRCSLLLFLLFSTVGWSRVGAFSPWRDLVSWLQLCFVVTAKSPEKAIRWCWLGAFCFLLFCLVLWVGISGVLGQRCLLVLVKTNLQTPCLSMLITL